MASESPSDKSGAKIFALQTGKPMTYLAPHLSRNRPSALSGLVARLQVHPLKEKIHI